MSFTYEIEDAQNDIAWLRLHIDDTVEEGAAFSDEEIQRVIDQSADLEAARVSLLGIKKVKLANEPESLQIGSTEIRQDIAAQVRAINSADGTLDSLASGQRNIPTRNDFGGEATT